MLGRPKILGLTYTQHKGHMGAHTCTNTHTQGVSFLCFNTERYYYKTNQNKNPVWSITLAFSTTERLAITVSRRARHNHSLLEIKISLGKRVLVEYIELNSLENLSVL